MLDFNFRKQDPSKYARPNAIHSDPLADSIGKVGGGIITQSMQEQRDATLNRFREVREQKQYEREDARNKTEDKQKASEREYRQKQDRIKNALDRDKLEQNKKHNTGLLKNNRDRLSLERDKFDRNKNSKDLSPLLKEQINSLNKEIEIISKSDFKSEDDIKRLNVLRVKLNNIYRNNEVTTNDSAQPESSGGSLNDLMASYKKTDSPEQPKNMLQLRQGYEPTNQEIAEVMNMFPEGHVVGKNKLRELVQAMRIKEMLGNKPNHTKGLLSNPRNQILSLDPKNAPSLPR
ncbi:MAG: hypothetical protein GY829_06300 [Gammaproteobacteria bacterium]|nr:hypothetical protein [Gammaproteobacteria bacterium]